MCVAAEPQLSACFLLLKLSLPGQWQGVASPSALFPAPLSATARAKLTPAVFEPEPAFVPPVLQARPSVCLVLSKVNPSTYVTAYFCVQRRKARVQTGAVLGR